MIYGNQIHKLAAEAQNAVAKAIENMTGLTVSGVNVNITGIQFEKEAAIAAERATLQSIFVFFRIIISPL